MGTLSLRLAAIACLVSASFWTYSANARTYHFSFNNDATNDPLQSLVQVTVSGLVGNANSSATSVQVTSNPAGFGLGEYVGNPTINIFTVAANGKYRFRGF